MHVISKNTRKTFLQLIIFYIFRACFGQNNMSEKMGKDIFAARQCTPMVFDLLKYHGFLYIITR